MDKSTFVRTVHPISMKSKSRDGIRLPGEILDRLSSAGDSVHSGKFAEIVRFGQI